ncbi:hypothetical protein ACIQ6R_35410 [Streptomyces sp. NPDC096048]|uniref:hypothetical protein n=1 Tax=Streptomyces sp. NPDC096048 TaxID=3366072 RepID=UPI00381F8546
MNKTPPTEPAPASRDAAVTGVPRAIGRTVRRSLARKHTAVPAGIRATAAPGPKGHWMNGRTPCVGSGTL